MFGSPHTMHEWYIHPHLPYGKCRYVYRIPLYTMHGWYGYNFKFSFKFLGQKKTPETSWNYRLHRSKKVSIGVDITSHQMSPEIGPRLVIKILRSHCICPSIFLGVCDLISMNFYIDFIYVRLFRTSKHCQRVSKQAGNDVVSNCFRVPEPSSFVSHPWSWIGTYSPAMKFRRKCICLPQKNTGRCSLQDMLYSVTQKVARNISPEFHQLIMVDNSCDSCATKARQLKEVQSTSSEWT